MTKEARVMHTSDRMNDIIRARAYEIYQHRCEEFGHKMHGHDQEDWLEAERQVMQEIEESGFIPVNWIDKQLTVRNIEAIVIQHSQQPVRREKEISVK